MHLCLNPDVRIQPFDGSSPEPLVLCEIPTTREGTPNRVVFQASLLKFLVLFDGVISTESAVKQYISQQSGSVHHEVLVKLAEGYLSEKTILIPAHRCYEPAEPHPSRRSYISVSCTLCPERVTRVLAAPLSWLFRPLVLWVLVAAFVCAQAYYFTVFFPVFHFKLTSITGGEFAAIMGLTTLSGLIHELGHASALAHYGSKRASIGWCIYIIWSAFYTDLSDAWTLSRRQRVVVDCGGMYFQAISQCILIYLIGVTHSRVLFYTCYAVDLQLLGCLNPLLRTDAYWIFSDLFGISNLRDRTFDAFTGLFKKLPRGNLARSMPKPDAADRIIRLYAFILTPIFIILPGISVFQVAFVVLPAFPGTVLHFVNLLGAHPRHPVVLASALLQLLGRALSIVGVVFLLVRIFRMLRRKLANAQLSFIRKAA